jgi:hypothetical protein
VNRLSGTGSWWQVRVTGMCPYPGARGVSQIAGSAAHRQFPDRVPNGEPTLQRNRIVEAV